MSADRVDLYRRADDAYALQQASRAPSNPWAVQLQPAVDDPEPSGGGCPCPARVELRGGRDRVIRCEEPAPVTGGVCPRCLLECAHAKEQAA